MTTEIKIIQGSSKIKSRPYDEGIEAAKQGIKFYENPYNTLESNRNHSHAWFAGWCYEKNEQQIIAKTEK